MGFLQTIAEQLAEYLKPVVKAKADELLTEVTDTIKKEIREHLPAIIEAVVKAVAETSAHLATDGVDKLTDVIPGDLDDKVIDPIAEKVLGDILHRFGL